MRSDFSICYCIMVAAVSATPSTKAWSQQNPARPPLQPSEGENGAGPRRPKGRDVTSRYMSSSTTSSSSSSSSSSANSFASRRTASPHVSGTRASADLATPFPAAAPIMKRAQSVERRRQGTPWPTPVEPRATTGTQASAASKLLFTSTRSLSVSFQGESFALQTSRTKHAPPCSTRKGTPERRRPSSARRGRDDGVERVDQNQMENAKPIDQQRWPGRSRQSNAMARSIDLTDEMKKPDRSVARALQHSIKNETPRPSVSRSIDSKFGSGRFSDLVVGQSEPSNPIASDSDTVLSGSSGAKECGGVTQNRGGRRGIMVPARFWQETNNQLRRSYEPGSPQLKKDGLKALAPKKLLTDAPLSSSPRMSMPARGLSSPLRGPVRPSSPSKITPPSSSSPLRRASSSPSMPRNPAVSTLSSNMSSISTPSVLNFAADIRRGRSGENRIINAHLSRLLYNHHLQWRFVNAQADDAILAQSVTTEKCLYNAWAATSKLRDSVRRKRKELQSLRLNLKLASILKEQMLYLDDWALLERGLITSLSGAIKALEASTLRLPIVGGAKVDIQSLKYAVSAAVDVTQAMAFSICSLLSKVEEMNSSVAGLARLMKQEHGLLEHCHDLLSMVSALEVKESSLRTNLLQLNWEPFTLTSNSL